MKAALNKQVNAELWSSYLYLSMSYDMDNKGYNARETRHRNDSQANGHYYRNEDMRRLESETKQVCCLKYYSNFPKYRTAI